MDSEEKPLAPSADLAPIPAVDSDKWRGVLDLSPRSIATSGGTAELPEQAYAETFLSWLTKSSSTETRKAYARDIGHFFRFTGIEANRLEQLTQVRPFDVAAWRDHLRDRGLVPASIGRKITVLRSLFSYLHYGKLNVMWS